MTQATHARKREAGAARVGGYNTRRPATAGVKRAALALAAKQGIPPTFANYEYHKLYQRLWQRAARKAQHASVKREAAPTHQGRREPATDRRPLTTVTCRYHSGVQLVRARAGRPSFSYSVKQCQGKRSRQIAAMRARRDAREILRCPVVDAYGRPCPWVAQLPEELNVETLNVERETADYEVAS